MSTSHVDNQSNQRDLLFTPSTNVIIICLIVLGLSTFLPLCVYHFYHVFVRRARLDSIKRHSTLCIAAIACLILSMIAQSMFQLVEFRTMRVSHGFRFTVLSAVILTNILFLNAQCIRFWLIWFHIEHYKLISVHEWKCIIDSHHNSKHSFFIRRKSSFGSPRFLCKCCLLETLLLIACIILIRFTVTDTAKREAVLYYGFVHIAVSYIALIVLLFKMSGNAFYDEFGVFNECKLLSLATTLTVSACILQVIGYEATANRLHLFASNAVSIVYLCAVYVMSMCCSTWCVYIMRSNSTAKVTNKQATNLSESASSKKLKLCDILAKNEYLSSFVVHLSQEMSLEVFLSMVEFMQFRAEIMKR